MLGFGEDDVGGARLEALGLHRGSRYHTDKRRRTLMLTYTSDRVRIFDYFPDQPWILSSPPDGRASPPPRARFFQHFLDIYGNDLRHRTVVAPEFRELRVGSTAKEYRATDHATPSYNPCGR